MKTAVLTTLIIASATLVASATRAQGSCEDVDFNQNGVVDEADIEVFKLLLGKFAGEDGFLAAADLDGSGVITPTDFQLMLSCR